MLLVSKLILHLIEAAELAIARPKLFQLGKLLETSEMLEWVSTDIENPKVDIGIETRNRSQLVVRNVEFFQALKA